MHMAAAAGTPTLGLFGRARASQYAPWGEFTALVRSEDPPEAMFGPGFDHRTTDTLMDGLSVDAAGGRRTPPVGRGRKRRRVSGLRPASLSALVVVHNEERQLADCLSLARLRRRNRALSLDRCCDRSREIARSFTGAARRGRVGAGRAAPARRDRRLPRRLDHRDRRGRASVARTRSRDPPDRRGLAGCVAPDPGR